MRYIDRYSMSLHTMVDFPQEEEYSHSLHLKESS